MKINRARLLPQRNWKMAGASGAVVVTPAGRIQHQPGEASVIQTA